jgi:hypothetical protein
MSQKLRAALDALYDALLPLFPLPQPQKLAVVSYLYPTAARVANEWAAIDAKANVCIINPSSGTGTSADASYLAQVDRSVAAGLTVYGYCPSTYGQRPIAETLAEIARLKQHYPKIHGVFIDEVASGDTSTVRSYYKQVFDKARSLGLLVVLNPGTACPESFMALCDVVMDCETSADKYASKVFPVWRKNYPRERFWHVVHTCDAATMPSVVDRTEVNHAGLVYVCETHDYNVLPPYFDALATKVKS